MNAPKDRYRIEMIFLNIGSICNKILFNDEKCRNLHLGRKIHMYGYKRGSTGLAVVLVRRILVDLEPAICHSNCELHQQ